MIPAADIVRELLIDVGLGTHTGAWPIYVGSMPDQPDESICVYDTAGTLDGRMMRTGEQIDHPGIQIRIRGAAYQPTRNKMKAVAEAVDIAFGSEISLESDEVYTVQNISRQGEPHSLGQTDDDRRRYNFTINAITTIRKET